MHWENRDNFVIARQLLSIAAYAKPGWIEPLAVARGTTGEAVLRNMFVRLWLYNHPSLFRIWRNLERVVAGLRWAMLVAFVRARNHIRLQMRGTVGAIDAKRVMIGRSGAAPTAAVKLSWWGAGTPCVELHLGRPDGPLIGADGALGAVTMNGDTLERDTLFYLQDMFRPGVPLSFAHTLAVMRFRLEP